MKKSEEIIQIILQEAKKQGIGPTELSKRIGCTRRQIHYMLKGERGISIDFAENALQTFGKSLKIEERKEQIHETGIIQEKE